MEKSYSKQKAEYPSSSVGILVNTQDLLDSQVKLFEGSDLFSKILEAIPDRVQGDATSVLLKNPSGDTPQSFPICKTEDGIVAGSTGKSTVAGSTSSPTNLYEAHTTFFGQSDVPTVTGIYDRVIPANNTVVSSQELISSKSTLSGNIDEGFTPLNPFNFTTLSPTLQNKQSKPKSITEKFIEDIFRLAGSPPVTLPAIYPNNIFEKSVSPRNFKGTTRLGTNNKTGTSYTPSIFYEQF